jgi:hypothetical protein
MNIKLTQPQRNTINAIIGTRTRMALDKEALDDDVKALAIELNLKPAQVNRLISLIIKEQNKGNVIEEENRLLELAEQMLDGGQQSSEGEAA